MSRRVGFRNSTVASSSSIRSTAPRSSSSATARRSTRRPCSSTPATGLAFWGGPEGAFAGRIVDGEITARHPIAVRTGAPIRIVASRSHGHEALAELCRTFAVDDDVSVGSSLKFCLLAQGDAQLYPRFTPTCEWDTAAGQAVLEAAGGAVVAIDGTPLNYGNVGRRFLNPFFSAAASRPLAEAAAAEMRRLLG